MTVEEAQRRLNQPFWDERLLDVLGRIRERGGHPLIVGGAIRDLLLERPWPKDLDVEVYGLSAEDFLACMKDMNADVDLVGASFGVAKIKGLNADFSLPRRDSKSGPGHRGFEVSVDPNMTITEAASRRDLTINSMAYDVFAGVVHDPFNGLRDLAEGVMAPTDPSKFLEDPLRALRAAQFASRLGFRPSIELLHLCQDADLSQLPGERIFAEFEKLLGGDFPDKGLMFMTAADLLRFFPELRALIHLDQDPEWHPEGTVWTHTMMAVRQARWLCGDHADMLTMWATLCHDLGKASATKFEDGRWRARGHEVAGIEPAKVFLERMRAPNALVKAVCAIVSVHLAPAMFCGEKGNAGPWAFRRLALKLADAGTSMETLERVSRADHFGRTTKDALEHRFEAGDEFLAKAKNLGVEKRPEDDAVLGRHLIAIGMQPGRDFKRILEACRDQQFESGEKNPTLILKAVLPSLGLEMPKEKR